MNPHRMFSLQRNAQGAAALPVVMILFFIMGIVFFYANRGLIFEQRSSANQYRSTQAFELADAGVNWALAMLNQQTKVDDSCAPSGTTGSTFKNLYLTIDTNTGVITPRTGNLRSACVVNADGTYSCSCPSTGAPAPAGTGGYFAVEFQPAYKPGSTTEVQPSAVQIVAYGCTSTGSSDRDNRCIAGGSGRSDGHAVASAYFGMIGGLSSAPVSTLSVRGAVAMQGAGSGVGVFNFDPETNGITIDSGSTVDVGNARLGTVPGSSVSGSVIQNDTALSSLTGDQLFASIFNLSKADYQKTAYTIDCAGGCGASDVQTAFNEGARNLWLDGSLEVTGNMSLGSVGDPVILVATGNVKFSANTTCYCLVYVAGDWNYTGGGGGFIRGAGVAEGTFNATNGTPDFYYEPLVLKILRTSVGAFVRVPGSWRDWI